MHMTGNRRTATALVFAASILLGATGLAACSGSPSSARPTVTTPASSTTKAPQAPLLYVSLGDSYAAGYQPTGTHSGKTDTNGFAYQIPALAEQKGIDLK